MITLQQIWSSFQSYANTFQGSWYRPNTDFQPAVNDISKTFWEQWTAQAEKSQEIRDHLQPFLRTKNLVVKAATGTYGLLETPSDYGRFSSARILIQDDKCVECKEVNGDCDNLLNKTNEEIKEEYFDKLIEYQVDLIENQKWASCLSHKTKKPTFEKPKITEFQNGWKVAPKKISVVVMDYYVRPKEGTFEYSIAPGDTDTGAGDYIVYNPQTSVPLEWPDTVLPKFVIELGVRFGIATREQLIIAVSQQQKSA